MSGTSLPHVLVVTAYDEDNGTTDYTVEHPAGCEVIEDTNPLTGETTREYNCPVQHDLWAIGIDDLLQAEESGILGPGRYPFEAWWDYDSFTGEHDGGLRRIEDA